MPARTKYFLKLLFALLLCCSSGAAVSQPIPPAPPTLAQSVMEVIPLRYRTAQEMIPLLQPLIVPGGTLSGFQGQLVVRTTQANLDEIKRVLASVDTAPRQLMISVRQDSDVRSERSAAGVSGSVGNDRARVTVPGSKDVRGGNAVVREGDDRLRVHVIEGRSNETDSNTQQIRVTEGREAFVRIGQSIPVRGREVRQVVVGGKVVEQVVDTTQYRDLSTGFYVLPRISGDRVTLDISPQREALSRQTPGVVNVQSVVTTVSGQLGQWMEIGGVGQDSSGQGTVLLGQSATSTRDTRRVQVKVDEVR